LSLDLQSCLSHWARADLANDGGLLRVANSETCAHRPHGRQTPDGRGYRVLAYHGHQTQKHVCAGPRTQCLLTRAPSLRDLVLVERRGLHCG
jgi:hypothetical protein